MITFGVSEVARAVDPLPEVGAREAIEGLGGGPVEAWWPAQAPLARAWTMRSRQRADGHWVAEPVPYHPFVAAAHAAFDQHRPLVLTPDGVWLMIAQGFAMHVAASAERLRSRIVAHAGREMLATRRDDFVKGDPSNPWPEVFADLSRQVAERTGPLHGLIVADFTTTDAASRAASEIALLAAAQPYFAYQLHTLCGIPAITLEGTEDDWRRIRERVEGLRAYETGAWIDALAPVLDRFVDASRGEVDRTHWQSFYKLKSASGGPYVTGWINVLLPYVFDYRGNVSENDDVTSWQRGFASPLGGGPTVQNLPSGLSTVPFLWKYLGTEHRMQFLGGFAGVRQDRHTLALRAEIGWAVRETPAR